MDAGAYCQFVIAPARRPGRQILQRLASRILRDSCVSSYAQSCSVRMFGNGRPRQVADY